MIERDTTPAPPPSDDVTRPDHQVPTLPSPTELLDAVGEFSREMRDSIQEIRSVVQDSNNRFLTSLNALEQRFDQKLKHLTDEVSRVHHQQIKINETLTDHEIRMVWLELRAKKPVEGT